MERLGEREIRDWENEREEIGRMRDKRLGE
jgi:hypothetical protein